MITLATHDDGAGRKAKRPKRGLALPASLVLALGLSACVQTTTNLTQPAPLAGNPMLLNTTPDGVAAADGAASAAKQPEPPPATAAKATPTPVVAAPAPAPAQPTVAATPPKPVAATPIPVSATEEAPSKGYPNINVVPPQPEGTLLPPDERAKIISELEALRAKQGGSAPSTPSGGDSATSLAKEGETHGADALKQIEKCSQEGAADLYPECAPAD